MYTRLGTVTLKSGERMACGVVVAPDEAWRPRIEPFLAQKRPEWRMHIAASLQQPLDKLETRFYVGTLEPPGPRDTEPPTASLPPAEPAVAGPPGAGPSQAAPPETEIITLVMVASARGVGLLGYVYTAPQHRQKGAYSALMAHQMADCAATGHRILTLTTGFESPAYWIYHRFGFRSIDGISGRMTWLAHPQAEQEWFRPAPTAVHPLQWDDWSTLNLTALRIPGTCRPIGHQADAPGPVEPPVTPEHEPATSEYAEELPRSWAFRLLDYGTAEGMFAQVLPSWAPPARQRAAYAATLRTAGGAVAGWVVLKPDDLTLGTAHLLDLYLHPAFLADGQQLLASVPWPERGAVTAYTSRFDGYRAALLREAGFRHAGTLPGWLEHQGQRLDVHAFRRG